MTGEVRNVEILLNGSVAEASFQGERVMGSSPAELWRRLGTVAGDGLLHLLPQDARPVQTTRAAAAIAAEGAACAIGRVRYGGGGKSPFAARTETLHYLDRPAGSLIVDARTLVSCADRIVRPWDRYWTRDVALALSRDQIVTAVNEIVAHVEGSEPKSHRLPVARANLAPPTDAAVPLILVYGRVSASTSLYFDGLPADIAAQIRFLEPGNLFSDLPWLCAADLVVIVRGFEHVLVTGAVDLLEEIGTPMLWFTDDDYMALATEMASLGYYTPDAVIRFARRMSGIGITSRGLADTLSTYHETILSFPCVLDRDLWMKCPRVVAAPARGAAFGGPFRRNSFIKDVLPAAQAVGLDLYATPHLARGQSGVRTARVQDDFRRFVLEWQRLAPSVVLHPYGDTANIGNKSPGSILAAAYLGAVPIFGREPAYEDMSETEGVLKADPDPESWRKQIVRVLDENSREELAASFRSWVETNFDPERARPAFAALGKLAVPRGRDADERLAAAMASRTLQRTLPQQPLWRRRLARLRLSLERRLAGRPPG